MKDYITSQRHFIAFLFNFLFMTEKAAVNNSDLSTQKHLISREEKKCWRKMSVIER